MPSPSTTPRHEPVNLISVEERDAEPVGTVAMEGRVLLETIRAALDRPRRRVLWDLGEWLHPHTPPDDPDWPTPVDQHTLRMTMRRLPHPLRTLCAVVAVARVLPWWEAMATAHPELVRTGEGTSTPRMALQAAIEWAMGNPTATLRTCFDICVAVRVAIEPAEQMDSLRTVAVLEGRDPDVRSAVQLTSAVTAARAAIRLAETVADESDQATASSRIAGVIQDAARAACPDEASMTLSVRAPLRWPSEDRTEAEDRAQLDQALAMGRFIEWWWARCRCMLAFAHVSSTGFVPPAIR
ncbi:MAG: hypothetical protein AB7K09_12750 [Planctomycetota bacterium]